MLVYNFLRGYENGKCMFDTFDFMNFSGTRKVTLEARVDEVRRIDRR